MAAGRPLKYQSVDELQQKIDEYFESCFEEVWCQIDGEWKPETDHRGQIRKRRVKPLTITGLAVHLGMTREGLLGYEERDEFADTIKRAKQQVQAFVEESLWEPKIASGVIFNLKNNFGWVDKQEVDQSSRVDATLTVKLEGDLDEWGS